MFALVARQPPRLVRSFYKPIAKSTLSVIPVINNGDRIRSLNIELDDCTNRIVRMKCLFTEMNMGLSCFSLGSAMLNFDDLSIGLLFTMLVSNSILFAPLLIYNYLIELNIRYKIAKMEFEDRSKE